jgi:hypothetical protein
MENQKNQTDFLGKKIDHVLTYFQKRQYRFRKLAFLYHLTNTLLVGSIVVLAGININEINSFLNYIILVNSVIIVVLFNCNLLFTPKELSIRYAKSAEEMKIIKEDFYLKKIKNNNLQDQEIHSIHEEIKRIEKEHFDDWKRLRSNINIMGETINKSVTS